MRASQKITHFGISGWARAENSLYTHPAFTIKWGGRQQPFPMSTYLGATTQRNGTELIKLGRLQAEEATAQLIAIEQGANSDGAIIAPGSARLDLYFGASVPCDQSFRCRRTSEEVTPFLQAKPNPAPKDQPVC